jgi:hypothetical protein
MARKITTRPLRTPRNVNVHHFLSEDEGKTAVKMWFLQQDAPFSGDGLVKLLEIWPKCVGD